MLPRVIQIFKIYRINSSRIYIQTYLNIYIYTYIHIYIPTYIHITLLHTHTQTYAHIHTYIHTYIHNDLHTYMYAQAHHTRGGTKRWPPKGNEQLRLAILVHQRRERGATLSIRIQPCHFFRCRNTRPTDAGRRHPAATSPTRPSSPTRCCRRRRKKTREPAVIQGRSEGNQRPPLDT